MVPSGCVVITRLPVFLLQNFKITSIAHNCGGRAYIASTQVIRGAEPGGRNYQLLRGSRGIFAIGLFRLVPNIMRTNESLSLHTDMLDEYK